MNIFTDQPLHTRSNALSRSVLSAPSAVLFRFLLPCLNSRHCAIVPVHSTKKARDSTNSTYSARNLSRILLRQPCRDQSSLKVRVSEAKRIFLTTLPPRPTL